MRLAYLDFEFFGVSERRLNLVSMSIVCIERQVELHRQNFWLFEGLEVKKAKDFLRERMKENYTFVAYAMEAEVRSLLTLFGSEREWLQNFLAIDLYLEYRCLLNHDHDLAYGPQYIDGKVVVTKPPPPKWQREESDDEAHNKPQYSLASACFKLLGIQIDTVEKDSVRELIIEGDREKILAARDRIQKYNMSDVEYLPELLRQVFRKYRKYKNRYISKTDWLKGAYSRGNYAARTARMVEIGYPINKDKIARFTSKTKEILTSAAKECLEVAPEVLSFRFDKKKQGYVANQKHLRNWVEAQNKPYWRKTSGGKKGIKQLSLSKDAFYDWYDSESDGFPGAYCRFLKVKQSLNGFLPSTSTKKGRFSDFVGLDNRVRPYFGIYGAQSSRSQPGSTGFIPLKAHWMRNFIEAPKGRALAGIDYSSQEFLIAAILSQDPVMIDAYASGDVYLAFAKRSGLIPPNGTKESHPEVRNLCKGLVLGISYDMAAKGLAGRLKITEDEAQTLIDLFYSTYFDYDYWKKGIQESYLKDEFLELPDKWFMWGDNDNRRSVGNFPVQGHGAVIMRQAVALAQDLGLDVIFTLHDALYIEYDSFDTEKVSLLMGCMQLAFEQVMRPYGNFLPIRLEGETWSRDYLDGQKIGLPENVLVMSEYSDEKGRKDLARYRPFFDLQGPVASIIDNEEELFLNFK